MLEGDDARRAVAEAGRRTTARRDLTAHERFEEISPEVGELDEAAFEQYLDEDPDAALAMLADLAGATDETLRALARRLAARIALDVARHRVPRSRGIGRIATMPAWRTEGDIDLDASLDALTAARAAGLAPSLDDLTVSSWRRPETAICLLIDRSGSMSGARLAAASVAASAVVFRHGGSAATGYGGSAASGSSGGAAVVAFSDQAVVVKAMGEHRSPDAVVTDLLTLRGHGVTDLGLALRAARNQLARSRAGRRVAIILSDCRVTQGGDPVPHTSGIDEIAVIAPADDSADADAFAAAVGARIAHLAGPADAAEAVAAVLLG